MRSPMPISPMRFLDKEPKKGKCRQTSTETCYTSVEGVFRGASCHVRAVCSQKSFGLHADRDACSYSNYRYTCSHSVPCYQQGEGAGARVDLHVQPARYLCGPQTL